MNETDINDFMEYSEIDVDYTIKAMKEKYDEEYFVVENKTKYKHFDYHSMLDDLLDHLENIGGVEFAVIKSPELGRYWAKKVKDREAVRKHEDALKKLKASLTKEEMKILGINIT